MDTDLLTFPSAQGLGETGLWQLIRSADPVVQAVVLVLLLASVLCWAIIFDKGFRLWRLRRKAEVFERTFWAGSSLDELYRRFVKRPDHPMALLFVNAMTEWREVVRAGDPESRKRLLERIARVVEVSAEREVEALERSLPWLATIGSVAPFVGLFGTVWGIMNSFQAIAVTRNTTLAVVAPGIAEALFATAIGLLAAIPAVVAYNKLSHALDAYAARLGAFGDELVILFGRELDALEAS